MTPAQQARLNDIYGWLNTAYADYQNRPQDIDSYVSRFGQVDTDDPARRFPWLLPGGQGYAVGEGYPTPNYLQNNVDNLQDPMTWLQNSDSPMGDGSLAKTRFGVGSTRIATPAAIQNSFMGQHVEHVIDAGLAGVLNKDMDPKQFVRNYNPNGIMIEANDPNNPFKQDLYYMGDATEQGAFPYDASVLTAQHRLDALKNKGSFLDSLIPMLIAGGFLGLAGPALLGAGLGEGVGAGAGLFGPEGSLVGGAFGSGPGAATTFTGGLESWLSGPQFATDAASWGVNPHDLESLVQSLQDPATRQAVANELVSGITGIPNATIPTVPSGGLSFEQLMNFFKPTPANLATTAGSQLLQNASGSGGTPSLDGFGNNTAQYEASGLSDLSSRNGSTALTGDSPSVWDAWSKGLLSPNALIPALTSVGSALFGSNSASKALSSQQAAAQMAIDEQRRQFDLIRSDNQPWLQTGRAAVFSLGDRLGLTPPTGPQSGSLNRPFTVNDFWSDPVTSTSFDFGLNEGRKAIDRMSGAKGLRNSGQTVKELTRFGTDYTGQRANESYNRYYADQDRIFNRLAGVSGSGQTATRDVSSAGTNSANNISNTLTSMGNARGAASIASGNAWSGAFNNIGNWWTNQSMLDRLLQARA